MKNLISTVINKDDLERTTAKHNSEIITRKELCKRLAITEPTAIRYGKEGCLPSFRIGNCVRYDWHYVLNCLIGDEVNAHNAITDDHSLASNKNTNGI